MLGEVELRGRLKAVHAAAQVDLVAVEGEDLFLGEGALDLDGEIGFLDLAQGGAVGRKKQVARQLHGQRGGALGAAVGAQVVDQRAEDAEEVDAPVGLEGLVFDGDDRLPQDGSEVVVIDHDAPLQGERPDDPAFLVVEVGGRGGAVALEIVNLGQVDRVDQREPGQGAGDDGQRDEDDERSFAGEFETGPRRSQRQAGAIGQDRCVRQVGLGCSQRLRAS